MALEELKQDILQQAKLEAKRLEEETLHELSEKDKHISDEVTRIADSHDKELQRELALAKRTKSAQTTAVAEQMVLDKKAEIIDAAFAEAKKKLKNKNKTLLAKLFKQAQKDITVHTVYCAKKDVSHFSGASATVKATPTIEGGFIAENKDGSISVDYTYDTLLARVKDRNLHNVTEVLF